MINKNNNQLSLEDIKRYHFTCRVIILHTWCQQPDSKQLIEGCTFEKVATSSFYKLQVTEAPFWLDGARVER